MKSTTKWAWTLTRSSSVTTQVLFVQRHQQEKTNSVIARNRNFNSKHCIRFRLWPRWMMTASKPIKVFLGLCLICTLFWLTEKRRKQLNASISVIHRDLCHTATRDVLLSKRVNIATMNRFWRHHDKFFSISCNDLALRILMTNNVFEDNLQTHVHGHYVSHDERVMEDEWK